MNIKDIDPKFRYLTDLIFFTDRTDIDLSNYSNLLKNHPSHNEYLLDRMIKSSQIAWTEGENYWSNRFRLIFSLTDKNIITNIERHLHNRMFSLLKHKFDVDIKYNIEYLQFVKFCQVKNEFGESLLNIKNDVMNLASHLDAESMINLVNSFTPFLFKDMNEYTLALSKNIVQAARSLEILINLQEKGVNIDFNFLAKLTSDLLTNRTHSHKNLRAFFSLINVEDILNLTKEQYQQFDRDHLIDLLKDCDYRLLEEQHLNNIKNVLSLDRTVADDLCIIYAEKLFSRASGHRKANADRIVRVIKTFPEISPKKILAHLSKINKMNDIKFIINSFPELKKLAIFV